MTYALAKRWLVLLALLAACRTAPPLRPAVAMGLAAPSTAPLPWAATIADSLYGRRILSAAGRDTLKHFIAAHALVVRYVVPGRDQTVTDTLINPANVLSFCADLFDQELQYRFDLNTDPGPWSQERLDSSRQHQRQRFGAALREAPGDTVAAMRKLLTPLQLIELGIRSEDQPLRTSWIFNPLPGTSQDLLHGIADSRSTRGLTRTRTARDYYALGLLTKPQYSTLCRELAAGKLPDEVDLTQRAAQLALDSLSYPVRRQAFDSILTRLTQAGVLSPGQQARALADSQVQHRLALFEVLPYCAHAQVFSFDSLPSNPALLYPLLLGRLARLHPALRFSHIQVWVPPHQPGTSRDEATLAFELAGRRYATTLPLDYELASQANTLAFEPIGRYSTALPLCYTRAQPLVRWPYPLNSIPYTLVDLLNQCLRDQHQSARFYLAPSWSYVLDEQRQALLLLTPAQRLAWGPGPDLLGSYEAWPDTLFTSPRIEQALGLYRRLGLLAGLSPAELARGRQRAQGGTVGSYAALLACFPRLVPRTDVADSGEVLTYGYGVQAVAASSRGAFRPTQLRAGSVSFTESKQTSRLSFVSGGHLYQATLRSDVGWMYNGFIGLLERAVRQTTNGQLYYLGSDETGRGSYLFLTAPQARALRQAQPSLFREHNAEAARSKQR